MFSSKTKRDPNSKGYHITPVMKVSEIEGFLDVCNTNDYEIIQVLYTGVVAQIIYKVNE